MDGMQPVNLENQRFDSQEKSKTAVSRYIGPKVSDIGNVSQKSTNE